MENNNGNGHDYPRFQWSKTIAETGEMFVVRDNDFNQYNEDIKAVKNLEIGKTVSQVTNAVGLCPKCGKKLIAATTTKGQAYKHCEDRRWLDGKEVGNCDYVDWGEKKVAYGQVRERQ